MTVEEAIRAGLEHHQAGRLAEAEGLYRQVLGAAPGHPDALHLLGVLAGQVGKAEAGVGLIRQAIAAAHAAGTAGEAVARYWNNLGNLLLALGRIGPTAGSAADEGAVAAYREAVRLGGDGFAESWANLSNALRTAGDLEGAIAAGREAVRRRPDFPDGLVSLGVALATKGALQEAIALFRAALTSGGGGPGGISGTSAAGGRRTAHAGAENNLCYALREAGQVEESVRLCREVVAKRPGDATGWKNLGLGLDALGNQDEAMDAWRRALSLGARTVEAWNGLGNALMRRGEIEEAVKCFHEAVAANPEDAWVHSNLLYALHLDPRMDARALLEAHRQWDRRHAAPLRGEAARITAQRPSRTRQPGKRLRVGYVSADLREHPVGRFLLPLMKGHGPAVEVVCYSDARFGDAVTAEFQRVVRDKGGAWRDIAGRSDAAVAELVRQDAIDLLVDLSMHAGYNRMLAFARKPAPVQVTYLAYPSTTGLEAMDWRLTDRFLDPPAAGSADSEEIYTERSWRLRSYWCYVPPVQAEGLEPSPTAGQAGRGDGAEREVTFGCLNNFSKVGRAVVEVWGRILAQVPRSRLVLHAREGSHRERVLEQLAARGVARERVAFVGTLPTRDYLQVYGRVDVGLDPFPYGGGTTTCDALWMGVPVVTLRGKTAVGRGGTSILSNVGLGELVAADVEGYVGIAVGLARDVGRLAELRAGMRERMRASALMDVAGYVADVEAAYRGMWEQGDHGN